MADDIATGKPMGIKDRIMAGVQLLKTGKLPNPLASEPKDTSRAALVKAQRLVDECAQVLETGVRGDREDMNLPGASSGR
jgi:hypothetical protein